MATKINLPEIGLPRIVIIGGGFGGISLARKLASQSYQVVLIDKNNYHQFQPLFYQVAMAGLEPSAISFPFRKLFQDQKNVFIRITEVQSIHPENKTILTDLGIVNYDHLIIATGVDTNFYGNKEIASKSIPMKSVAEALYLRNSILSDYEMALSITDYEERQEFLDIVVVGGGPTGVEVAGALAEMKKFILPRDYPELDCDEIDIHLIQGSDQLLNGMSRQAGENAKKFLEELGVRVVLDKQVTAYDGHTVTIEDGSTIPTRKLIWAAGIRGIKIPGLPEEAYTYGGRIAVDQHCAVKGISNIYCIGDIAYMETEKYPKGHPQVAQLAIQQGTYLAKNLRKILAKEQVTPFEYDDKGSMATIGRNKAVVDLPKIRFQGAFAWFVWLVVHLFSIIGVRNKLFVFMNWVTNYFTYNPSLRLIIRPKTKPEGE